jgi:exopolyphosphatase / guanosine-5'-triphosphate,3'-diphosphate pyrophosphatase
LRKLDSEADGSALVESSVRDARGQAVDRNSNRSRGDKP